MVCNRVLTGVEAIVVGWWRRWRSWWWRRASCNVGGGVGGLFLRVDRAATMRRVRTLLVYTWYPVYLVCRVCFASLPCMVQGMVRFGGRLWEGVNAWLLARWKQSEICWKLKAKLSKSTIQDSGVPTDGRWVGYRTGTGTSRMVCVWPIGLLVACIVLMDCFSYKNVPFGWFHCHQVYLLLTIASHPKKHDYETSYIRHVVVVVLTLNLAKIEPVS